MIRYTHVEDYLEVIAGLKDPATLAKNNSNWFTGFDPIISLARYDVSVLESMSEAVSTGKALTQRQGELAVKIVAKYQRQLAQKGIDVAPVLNPQWRYALRKMDYSRYVGIEDNVIVMRFPFANNLIDELREFRKGSQGKVEWNKDRRQWQFALTEYNLVYLKTWAEQNQFTVDDEIQRLNALISAVEQVPYAIELQFNNGELAMANASASLINYINEHCGGFATDNLPRLIDMSSVLGYTVSDDIRDAWLAAYGARTLNLTTHREVKIDPATMLATDDFASVLDYADLVGRYPVVIYEPDTSNKMLTRLTALRKIQDIDIRRGRFRVSDTPGVVDDTGTVSKYIHCTAPIRDIKIGLLISSAGMMFGGDKSIMMQNAEKAVYCTTDVYTSNKNHKVPDLAGQVNNQR
jgi:hypothetical protein